MKFSDHNTKEKGPVASAREEPCLRPWLGRQNSQIRKPPLNWKKPYSICSAEALGARKTGDGTPCTCLSMYQ
ncbi:MAG: hypothetical protein SWE60_14385, partial [Thermodesulfobacteriota bacterium]|nr:hypothetical protein [Thermodesulfobacteriota bacterium]